MKRELVWAVLGVAVALACGKSKSADEPAGAVVGSAPEGAVGSSGSSGSTSAAGSGVTHAGVAGVGGGGGAGGANEAGRGGEQAASQGGAGGEGGGDGEACEPTSADEQCLQDRQLTLAPFEVVDASGDGQVSAGEGVTLKSALINPGPDSHNWYPGVAFTVSDPDVVPPTGDWHNLFGLGAGQSHPFELSFEMPADAPAGSVIIIEVVPSSINPQTPCCGRQARQIELVIASDS